MSPLGTLSSPAARARALGAAAALFWALACVRWFDAGAPFRPAWLAALPAWVLGLPALALVALWVRARRSALWGAVAPEARGGLLLVAGLAILFRLPLAFWGAAGYMSADECLTGIVGLHLREGLEHPVFLPQLQYNGTLRSHPAALLFSVMDAPRAFVLLSVGVYALFVVAVYRLALLLPERSDGPRPPAVAAAAGLYAAFAPTFVTQYCLMTDVYVEVLALGTWALLLAVRWTRERDDRPALALATGLLLGLGFWGHILAVIHVGAVGLLMLLADWRGAFRALPRIVLGFALGYFPGLLWNAGHGWESFRYLVPGVAGEMAAANAAPAGPGLAGRIAGMVSDQWPILLGYDPGYPALLDLLFRGLATVAVIAACVAVGGAVRRALHRPVGVEHALLLLTAVNIVVALTAVRYIAGDPRYLLFLMGALPVSMARTLDRGWRRGLLAALIAFGALGTLAQARSKIDSDARWRRFVSDLREAGVRYCYTDFFLATKINFLSEERVVCSSKLGPNRTEYFFSYRRIVDEAPSAALVAVNATNADKLERRLARLGVDYARRDLMKPVLLPSRKVDPAELYPGQEFGLR